MWEAGAVEQALVKLKALQGSVREALGKGKYHQLAMVDQLLTDYVVPMLEEGWGGP